MLNLQSIQADLVAAMKAKDSLATEVLRGLKTRIMNEQVAKMTDDLSEESLISLVRSEIKRRKDAAQSFVSGGRTELAEKEEREAAFLAKYLPAEIPVEKLEADITELIAANSFVAADFGKAMGLLKTKFGNSADGAVLAKILKAKLS